MTVKSQESQSGGIEILAEHISDNVTAVLSVDRACTDGTLV